jgi:hypothetical protein
LIFIAAALAAGHGADGIGIASRPNSLANGISAIPFKIAWATATVGTVSSIKVEWRANNGNSVCFTGRCSYTEPITSPAMAPGIDGLRFPEFWIPQKYCLIIWVIGL